jgi:hypothetical protein
LDQEFCLTIKWIRADRKVLSASNHNMQDISSDVMTVMITSFPDGKGGWTDLLEKLYVCTTIPYGVLVGRPLIENAALDRHGDSAQGIQRFGPYSWPFMPPPEQRLQGQRVKVPAWAILDTLLKPHSRRTIPCTAGTLFSSSTGALEVRSAEVGTDIVVEDEVHPSVYQVITIDGRTKDIVMMNDSDFPVLIATGSLVLHARVIEDDVKLDSTDTAFDPREAAADPFGVGAITANEILRAMTDAIAERLTDFPAEVDQVKVDVLAAKATMQFTEGETRMVQDIRKRFLNHIASNVVQTERVNLVYQAQQDLAAEGRTGEPAYIPQKGPPPTPTQTRLREKLAARATSASSAARAAEPADQTNPFEQPYQAATQAPTPDPTERPTPEHRPPTGPRPHDLPPDRARGRVRRGPPQERQ